MNNYIDKYGRYHHKPCINGEPSSGNAWIYTAYANKLLILDLDRQKLGECFNLCRIDTGKYIIHNRNPYQSFPPISRDEILGMVALGLLKPKKDIPIGWNFSPFPLPKFSPTKLLSQLWQLRPEFEEITVPSIYDESEVYQYETKIKLVWKHRNYFWENNLDQIYRFAFSVPLQDRHFILQKWGKFNVFYWAVAKIDSLGKPSGLRWLKYGGEKNKKAMLEEFPTDHPIRGLK